MGLAFTNQDIIEEVLVTGTVASSFLADLDLLLRRANWGSTPITDGYEYTIVTPQALTATLRIWDPHETDQGVPYVYLQFQPDGIRHRIGFNSTRSYRVWANCCQIFLAVPGVTGRLPYWNTVAGGIPYTPNVAENMGSACEAAFGQGNYVTDIWWSCGSGDSSAYAACSFRNELNNWSYPGSQWYTTPSNGYMSQSTHYNGTLQASTDGILYPPETQLRCLSLQNAGFLPWHNLYDSPHTYFVSGRPLLLEPYLAWGNPIPKLRGQIWDAMVVTKSYSVDQVIDFGALLGEPLFDRIHWRQWTASNSDNSPTTNYGDWFGTLFLLLEPPPTPGSLANIAY